MKMGKNNSNRRGYLQSRMSVGARLATRMSSVKRTLDLYPSLRPIRSGTCLEYLLGDAEGSDHFYSVRLEADRAYLTIFSRTTPVYFIQEAVLRLLSILQTIGKEYEPSFHDLYPYLILALSSQQTRQALLKDPPLPKDNSDLVLAKRIIQLMRENAELKGRLGMELRRSRRTLQALVVAEAEAGAGIGEIAKAAELSREEVERVLPTLHEIGYKAIQADPDRFDLVRM
jgi:hypothetical protein